MDLLWHDGKLLGIDWSVWKLIGWCGNLFFFSRFFVQWYATERRKQVVVPTEEAEKIFALVSGRRRPEDIRKAYNVLRAMFSRAS